MVRPASVEGWCIAEPGGWCVPRCCRGAAGRIMYDTRASEEFRAVVVKELGEWTWRAASDLLESVGRVVVLAGEDRPLARDEQLSPPRRYAGPGEALKELRLRLDPKGPVSTSSAESSSSASGHDRGAGPVRSWCA